jgi:PAS domain S-box-containing protein
VLHRSPTHATGRPPPWRRYAVAIGTVASALLLSLLARPLVEPNPFLLFFAAIAISAWYGGIWSGLLATLLSVLLTSFFLIRPFSAFSLTTIDALRVAVFAFVAMLISLATEERRRAEERAQAQGEQLRVTLASIGDAVIATDAARRVTFMNAVAETLTGWSAADAAEREIDVIFRIVNAQTRQPVESPVARVLREGRVVGLANHTRLIARDGTERPIDDSGAPIRNAAGALVGVVLVFRDVTEREQAETARAKLLSREQAARMQAEQARERAAFLSDASRLLAGSLEYVPTLQRIADLAVPRLADWCVVDMADDGAIEMVAAAHVDPAKVQWAHELRRMYPVDPAAPVGAPQVIRSGEPEIYPDIPDSLLESVARSSEELRILREVGYRSIMVVPLRARGRVLGAITLVAAESARHFGQDDLAFAQDLADRAAVAIDNARLYQAAQVSRDATERAATQLARLLHVTAALGEALTPEQVADVVIQTGLAAVDADGGSIFALADDEGSFLVLSFRGYAAEQAPADMRIPADAPGPLHDVLRTRAIVTVETPAALVARWPHLAEAQARSGDAATATVPLLIDQRILGVLYVAFRAARTFSAEDTVFLQALARQCAQALDRARLYDAERQARAAAERAVRARDEFLSVAAHELKTPLTSLLLQVQLLQRRTAREGTLGERDTRALRVVADQSRRLERMIAALLDISRLEQGQLSISRERLDLCALVERVVAENQLASDANPIVCELPDEPLAVDGDELRLEQVFQNLLQNAIKYSPDGGAVKVHLASHPGQICVTVTDHGLGIPQESIPHLFTRFYRAANVDPRSISGMGIGLYVVKEIVGLHGGTVAVESAEGQGSVFTVCLPRAGTAAEPAHAGGADAQGRAPH